MIISYMIINCELEDTKYVIEDISQIPQVKEVRETFGVYDIFIKFVADTDDEMRKIWNDIRKIRGIVSTTSLYSLPDAGGKEGPEYTLPHKWLSTFYVMANIDRELFGKEKEIINCISQIPQVKEVRETFGVYDIFIKIRAETIDKIHNIVTDIRKIRGIAATLSLVSIQGLGREMSLSETLGSPLIPYKSQILI